MQSISNAGPCAGQRLAIRWRLLPSLSRKPRAGRSGRSFSYDADDALGPAAAPMIRVSTGAWWHHSLGGFRAPPISAALRPAPALAADVKVLLGANCTALRLAPARGRRRGRGENADRVVLSRGRAHGRARRGWARNRTACCWPRAMSCPRASQRARTWSAATTCAISPAMWVRSPSRATAAACAMATRSRPMASIAAAACPSPRPSSAGRAGGHHRQPGLCGAFNANLIREARRRIEQLESEGRRGRPAPESGRRGSLLQVREAAGGVAAHRHR